MILNFERLYLENELSFSKKNFTIASFSRLTTNLCKNLRKIFWAGVEESCAEEIVDVTTLSRLGICLSINVIATKYIFNGDFLLKLEIKCLCLN